MPAETDVLIIGAGAAGLVAALAAHEAGAMVTVIEKGERLGGTAAISGGIVWVADNPRMKEAGIADSADDALAYFQSLDHGEMDPDVLEAFVREGPKALEFLAATEALKMSILPGYPDYYLDRPGAKPQGSRALDNDLFDFRLLGEWADKIFHGGDIYRLMLRETPLGGGSGMIDSSEMQRRVERRPARLWTGNDRAVAEGLSGSGIEPLLSCRAHKLLWEDDRIVGVEVEQNGQRATMMANRGVILATGGFEWNAALKKHFCAARSTRLLRPRATPATV